jgi:hypothetical protein
MRRLVLVLMLAGLVAECGKKSPTSPTDPPSSSVTNCIDPAIRATGTVSASIGGTPFTTSFLIAVYDAVKGEFHFSAQSCALGGYAISLTLDDPNNPPRVGTFSITGTSVFNRGRVAQAKVVSGINNGEFDWATTHAGGSGSVTFTTLSSSGAAGTFSFTAIPEGDASGTKTVTGGSFNVTRYSPG